MRRNQLQRTLNRVKSCTPRLFWQECYLCKEEFKGERMFYFKHWIGGALSTTSYKIWFCTSCCPTREDVILKAPTYFQNVDTKSLTPTHGVP